MCETGFVFIFCVGGNVILKYVHLSEENEMAPKVLGLRTMTMQGLKHKDIHVIYSMALLFLTQTSKSVWKIINTKT